MTMDTALLTGIIGAIATLVSPIIVLLLKNYFANRPFQKLKGRNILGKWTGKILQEFENTEISYNVIFHLQNKGRQLCGEVLVEASKEAKDEVHHLVIKGGLFENRFVKIEYKNKDKNVLQFGIMLMELMPTGNHLIGRFTGFGHITRRVIYGSIELKK